jgi:hypothetical protein
MTLEGLLRVFSGLARRWRIPDREGEVQSRKRGKAVEKSDRSNEDAVGLKPFNSAY